MDGEEVLSGTVDLSDNLKSLTVNDKLIGGPSELLKLQEQPGKSVEKCVLVNASYEQYRQELESNWNDPNPQR